MLSIHCVPSPIGPLRLVGDDEAVTHLLITGQPAPEDAVEDASPLLLRAAAELRSYLAGELRTFDLPLRPHGTPFQQTVWAALQAIPYGETVTYRDLAVQIGRPTAARAVGGANGKNPIPILIPCHRVVASGGSLGGYSLGLEMKRWLLELEGART